MATSSSQRPPPGTAQPPLGPHVGALQRLKLWDDYGEVGEGASTAHYIRAENGNEYIAKGPAFNPSLPYVAANELICVELGGVLALPLLDHQIIEHGTDLFFGSSWIEKNKTFYPALDAALFARAANSSRSYDIVAFDYWVYNPDRHAQNLIVRKQPLGGSTAELMTLNDHSHALIEAGKTPADMASYVNAVPPIHLDFLRDAITSSADLSGAVSLIEGVTTATIQAVVDGVPTAFLAQAERALVVNFLVERRERLRQMFNDNISLFKMLGGKKI